MHRRKNAASMAHERRSASHRLHTMGMHATQRVKLKYSPVRVKPWVFSALGRPGEQFCVDIRRLARERLNKPDARCCVSRESLRQLLLRRWRSEIPCAIAVGVANTLLEAVEGTAANAVQLTRSTALHDLQAYRLTGY
eukprot:gene7768-biopygen21078